MLRRLHPLRLIACLALAAAFVAPLEPGSPRAPSPWRLEVEVGSDHAGLVQLYYDVGRGINEADSSIRTIGAGETRVLSFALPCGRYRALRFDPLDRDGTLTLARARVVDGSGRTRVAFAPDQFRRSYQIDRLEVRGDQAIVTTTPGGNDPQLLLVQKDPLVVPGPFPWRSLAWAFAVCLAGLAAFDWAEKSPRVRLRERSRGLWGVLSARPKSALVLGALAGTLTANYPVVFAGRSVVTPSYGVALLYGQNPWLPGNSTADVGDAHKADVAALMWQHLPWSMLQRKALFEDGELPLWDRYDSAGSALLGQGQSCFGDPLQVIPILGNGASWAWDLKFVLAKALFALGVGLCAWSAFRSLPAALMMSASAGFVGLFLYRINHPAIFSLCYAPWILYAWIRLSAAASARGWALWTLALMGANAWEMASGTAKEAYVLLLTLNLAGACVLVLSGLGWARTLARLAGLVAAGALFAMITAPLWLTFYHELGHSYTSYNVPQAFQLQPGMLLGLFDEAFYRPFQVELGVVNPSANAFVLVGLLWAAVRWRAVAADPVARALALSTLPLFALAFGVVPPALIERVPFLGNILHVDNTFSCALIVILFVLCSFGWKQAWERVATEDGRGEGILVVGLFAAILAVFLGTAQATVRSAYYDDTWGKIVSVPAFIHAYGWSLVAAGAVLLWALRGLRRGGDSAGLALVAAAAACVGLHWREGLHTGSEYPDFTVTATHRVDLQAPSPTVDAVHARSSEPSRALGFHNDLLPGWSGVYRIEGISGPDALVNPYYRELMDGAGFKRLWDWRYILETGEVRAQKPFLDALNVRFYLAYHQSDPGLSKVLRHVQSADMELYESPSVWPRAFFTDSVAVYTDLPQFLSWLKSGDGRPFAGIQHSDWVELSPVPRVSGDLGSRKVSPASNYRLTGNTTSFTVTASGPGFIVLSETYERGNFRVTVNGRDTPYLRVNHAFKGVYVDAAGTYEVAFTYRPQGFAFSLGLSLAGLGLLAVGVALVGLRRQPSAV